MVYYHVLTPTGIGFIFVYLELSFLKRYHFAWGHEYLFLGQTGVLKVVSNDDCGGPELMFTCMIAQGQDNGGNNHLWIFLSPYLMLLRKILASFKITLSKG